MKSFKEFLKEQPTNSTGSSIATYDPFLFPKDMDLLDQGYQTPAEPGLSKWETRSNVYPVMKVTLSNNKGDGPSIDDMVAASKEFVDRESQKVVNRVRKTYQQFMGYR
tara:strand:- start:2219 stop:2542 length:324 start_codon:yes stop_codon:yes gene_type:complete